MTAAVAAANTTPVTEGRDLFTHFAHLVAVPVPLADPEQDWSTTPPAALFDPTKPPPPPTSHFVTHQRGDRLLPTCSLTDPTTHLGGDPSSVPSPQKFTRVIITAVGTAANTTPVTVGRDLLTHFAHLVAVPVPLVDPERHWLTSPLQGRGPTPHQQPPPPTNFVTHQHGDQRVPTCSLMEPTTNLGDRPVLRPLPPKVHKGRRGRHQHHPGHGGSQPLDPRCALGGRPCTLGGLATPNTLVIGRAHV